MRSDEKQKKAAVSKKRRAEGITLGCIAAVLIVFELHWHSYDVRAVASSPSGYYTAKVSTHFYSGEPWGTKVHLWPKWAPIPSLFATQVFDAPCQAVIAWKSERDLEILCPNPEGQPQVHIYPWAVEVSVKGQR